jgi:hypothetical protein
VMKNEKKKYKYSVSMVLKKASSDTEWEVWIPTA